LEHFSYMVSVMNDTGCTHEIKYRASLSKAAFNKKEALFNSKLDCTSYVCLLYYVCVAVLTLDVGLLARSQNPEGPATGHLDTGFLVFPLSKSEC